MDLKLALNLVLKQILLTLAFVICFVAPTLVIPVSSFIRATYTPEMEEIAGPSMLAYSFCAAFSVFYILYHARLYGPRLVGSLIVALFGLLTLLGVTEIFYFRSAFPLLTDQDILDIGFRGFITALLFAPFAAIVVGKLKPPADQPPVIIRLGHRSWLWKLPLLAVVYVILYILFGYFVAWQSPEVRLFYSGSTELLGFFEHLGNEFTERPSFLPFQFLRGLLWIAFALPVVFLLGGMKRQAIVGLALLFSLTGIQLIMPNPFFPDEVRLAHLIEVMPSTALYGVLIGWLLHTPHPETAAPEAS